MKNPPIYLLIVLTCLTTACNKTSTTSSNQSPAKPPDAVELKLREYAGSSSATDCGRLDVRATADQSKTAADCAMQAGQGKRPFYVTYDMPGMTVGVAGSADGKLFTVQAQGAPAASVTAGACPSQLRVASSGRVTCFAPGDMGGMGGSHAAGAVPLGMANPHTSGTDNPHGSSAKPPSN